MERVAAPFQISRRPALSFAAKVLAERRSLVGGCVHERTGWACARFGAARCHIAKLHRAQRPTLSYITPRNPKVTPAAIMMIGIAMFH
jgi:hypothetical protein